MEPILKQGVPTLSAVTSDVLRVALRRGWTDMRHAIVLDALFSGVYVGLGWLMLWVTIATGKTYWMIFAAVGFPLVGPFAAVGFYEISRRRRLDLPLIPGKIFTVIFRQSRRQLPSISAIILFMFLFWFFLAHMIFALFLGLSTMTNVSSSFDVFLTPNGLAMLAVGTFVGGVFALVLYMISVLALPLMLDREIDFVTAMITSFQYVQNHALVMLAWAVFIGATTLIALIPGFLGLFVVLPLLGHASWHVYDSIRQDD